MPKFLLNCRVTVSAYTEVVAETVADAINIAEGRDVAIGGNGSGQYPDESWIIDDADGSPEGIYYDDV